jgi:hypothetical protein
MWRKRAKGAAAKQTALKAISILPPLFFDAPVSFPPCLFVEIFYSLFSSPFAKWSLAKQKPKRPLSLFNDEVGAKAASGKEHQLKQNIAASQQH